jgi:DNA polymerase/3'-5' exonuclease PolX
VKTKFPRAAALDVARELTAWLDPVCEYLVFAGSLRRRKAEVGDIEVLYIPKYTTEPDGLFDAKQVNLVDLTLEKMLFRRLIAKRLNKLDSETWGPKNKLAIHRQTGIPIDFFQATHTNRVNYLVCRTGSAITNTNIATAAIKKGWKWHPFDAGFTDEHGNLVPVHTEQDVFNLVGLPYLEPWQR